MSIGLLTMNHRIPRDGAISCYFKDNVQDIVFTNSNLKLFPSGFFFNRVFFVIRPSARAGKSANKQQMKQSFLKLEMDISLMGRFVYK